jgi:hypothetical protein
MMCELCALRVRSQMTLLPDWLEFIELLNSHGVEYVIVGAWARAFYGPPRSTGDIDFFVRPAPENAGRLLQVLQKFGFGSLGITPEDFLTPGRIIQLGIDPYRIKVQGEIDGLRMQFLSLPLSGRTSSPRDAQKTGGSRRPTTRYKRKHSYCVIASSRVSLPTPSAGN